jgi:hypothetical protein
VDRASGGSPKTSGHGQKLEKRRYRKAFLGKSRCSIADISGFQINWTTGRFDRNKGYHYGVVARCATRRCSATRR